MYPRKRLYFYASDAILGGVTEENWGKSLLSRAKSSELGSNGIVG